jgi:ABC-type transport system involved in multi-copper enzyme maturation permease subunit
MNIFLRELRANLKPLIIWGVIVILFVIMGFSKFAAYEGNPELLAILDEMPPAVLSAFNFNAFNLTTVTGFYGVMFTYFAIILSAAAVMWACAQRESCHGQNFGGGRKLYWLTVHYLGRHSGRDVFLPNKQ